MVTKGIVEEIINVYQAKVRLPVYDGFADTKNATSSDELTIASICNIPNIYNTIAVGDIVYVAFEDNDLGNPVILGQLYKEEMNTLADIKLNSANINQLTINKNASLPQNTSIGSISSKEIAALSGIKDNIQNQIDNNLPVIEFAEEERQKTLNLFNANDVIFDNSTYGYIPIKNVTDVYCLSLQNDRGGDLTGVSFGICNDPTSSSSASEKGYFWLIRDNGKTIINSVDANITARPYVFFYPKNQSTLNAVLTRFDVMLNNGNTQLPYQPYNGAIIHEKEIKPVLLYDKDIKNRIGGTAYADGIKIGTTVNLDISLYKELKIYSRRNYDQFISTLDLTSDVPYPCCNALGMNEEGAYYVFHVFKIDKSNSTINFLRGGYHYVDNTNYTPRVLETADSNNLIYRIEGIR